METFLDRAWDWFVGKKPVPDESSGERYVLTVRPAGKRVKVAINCTTHVWLRHLAGLEPMGVETLVMEVSPDKVGWARKELTREADRLVRALKAAWEHGWRPG